MFSLKRIFTGLLLIVSAACFAQGQAHKVSIDKIIGVVGDRIILQSDIGNAMSDAARAGEELPPNAPCMIMEQMLLSKIMAQQAEKDSLPVSDEDVEAKLDLNARNWIMQYGSVQAVEELAGKSIYQLKDDSRAQIKEQMLADAMRRKIIENVHITPAEVTAFFNKVPADSLPYLESEVEVGQINIYPKASKDVEDYIYNEMIGYKKQIEAGSITFENLAKKVSEDPGSKDRGGAYEVSRNDKATWDPVFLSTAFRLKQGQISDPVKSSKFGFFLIKLEDRRGDDAKVRMILRIPQVTEIELNNAKEKLDSVRKEIVDDKKINFKDAAYKYSEDENVKNYGPFILNNDGSTYVTLDRLDKDLVNLVGGMKVGEISQPQTFTNEQGKRGVRLIYLQSKSEPHRLNLKDDYAKISEMAGNQKKNQELDKWLSRKIPDYYIMVDDQAAAECGTLSKYQSSSKGF